MDGTAKIWNWHSPILLENENKTSLFTMTYDNFKVLIINNLLFNSLKSINKIQNAGL